MLADRCGDCWMASISACPVFSPTARTHALNNRAFMELYAIIARMLIPRRLQSRLEQLLGEYPAVGLLGPRQAGKTTLALEVAERRAAVYLDLESPRDRARLTDPESFLEGHENELVILDEVHRMPALFQTLRSVIDRGRRKGRRAGRFLLLGSAAVDLLAQSGETLAGRISYVQLGPFDVREVPGQLDALWVRGGFPPSLLAPADAASFKWRADFVRTYLERDVPQFGPRIPAEMLRRFWTMLAHLQGGLLNAAQLARALAVDAKTVARYLDLMVDLLLVRRLMPWHQNVGKRLVRSPKVFIRDSGLVHVLLGLRTRDEVLGHPVAGHSWEGLVIETLINAAPDAAAHFYRTSHGAEIDLLLVLPGRKRWAIEVKRSSAPGVDKGFHLACADVKADERFVVYAGVERYPLGQGVTAIGLAELAEMLDR